MLKNNWGNAAKVIVVAAAFAAMPSFTHACGPVNLSIVKSGPSTAEADSVVTYSVTITQVAENAAANEVKVFDQVPAGLTFNAAQSSSQCSLSGETVTCKPKGAAAPFTLLTSLEDQSFLLTGQSKTFIIAFNVPENPSPCEIQNTASVISSETPNAKNSNTVVTQINCATPTPAPKNPGLRIQKTDNRETVTVGQEFSYTLTLENTGDVDMQDIEIIDNVPDVLTVISASHKGQVKGNQVTWKNINLDASAKTELTLKVKVKAGVPTGEFCNKATAKSEDHGKEDEAQDCTELEKPQVKAAVVVKKPAPPVQVTAATGAGEMGAILTLLGSAGLAVARRFTKLS